MADNDESARGPVPPYGPAIWDAAKRGDLNEMEHVADAARVALAKGAQQEGLKLEEVGTHVAEHFHAVADHEVVAVREALTHLEQHIAQLRAKQTDAQKQAPQGEAPPQ
jgi:hypothetical protein